MGRADASPTVELPKDVATTRSSRRDVVKAGAVVAGGVAAVYIRPSLTRIQIPTALAASGGPQGQTGGTGGTGGTGTGGSGCHIGSISYDPFTKSGTFTLTCDQDDTITALSATLYGLTGAGAVIGTIATVSASGFVPSAGTACKAGHAVTINYTITSYGALTPTPSKFQLTVSVTTAHGSATATYNF